MTKPASRQGHGTSKTIKSFPSHINLPALQLLHLIDFWGIDVHMSLIPLQLQGTPNINIHWTLCFIFAVCLRVRSEKRSEWQSRSIQHHTWKEKHGMKPDLEGCSTAEAINFSYRVEYPSAAETWLTPSGPQHLCQISRLEAVFSMQVNKIKTEVTCKHADKTVQVISI